MKPKSQGVIKQPTGHPQPPPEPHVVGSPVAHQHLEEEFRGDDALGGHVIAWGVLQTQPPGSPNSSTCAANHGCQALIPSYTLQGLGEHAGCSPQPSLIDSLIHSSWKAALSPAMLQAASLFIHLLLHSCLHLPSVYHAFIWILGQVPITCHLLIHPLLPSLLHPQVWLEPVLVTKPHLFSLILPLIRYSVNRLNTEEVQPPSLVHSLQFIYSWQHFLHFIASQVVIDPYMLICSLIV